MTNEFHAIAEDELQCQGCGHKTHKQTDSHQLKCFAEQT